jgi:two-component system sensor histidine kinase BaeS
VSRAERPDEGSESEREVPRRADRVRDRYHRGNFSHPYRRDFEAGPWGPRRPWAHHGPRPRPKWWPQDEPWPPVGEFPWHKVRRRFLWRFAVLLVLAFVLLIIGPIVLLSQVLSATGLPAGTSNGVAVGVVVVLLVVAAIMGRGARRFAVPFGDLIEATGKVESGDYAARVVVPNRGMQEMRWLSEAFNSMAARLEVDERQRRSLLADVSHELRTPLAVLRGELEAMIDGVHPIDEAHLTAAVDQIGMLTKLVEDLRTLALAEAGTLALHPEPTDLSILAQEVSASFAGLAEAADISLQVDMPANLPLVDLDPLRIQQVIGNLVANALGYAPRASTVSILGAAPGPGPGTVTISVVDHGPGIAPELLPHLFERFVKSDDSRGSGLGLAIARRLVEAHGGSIRAESPAGGGTSITFELPAGIRAQK